MCVLFSFPLSGGFISADTAVRRRLAAETRGDRAPMVPFPLLTPQTLLWTRLPPVARLNARSPQGRSLLQGYTLDRSGAFRSANPAPCTVWPRTVMRGGLRKLTSGPDSVPKPARRPEPSPRNPRLAANALLSGSKEGLGESRGGKGTIRCPFPLLPLSAGAGTPPAAEGGTPPPCHGEHPPTREGLTRLRRQAAGTAEPLTPAPGRESSLGQLLLPSEEENEPHSRRNGDKKDHRKPEPRG